MRIAYISAGAGGMFCGSCLHDNTLAAALVTLGHDALLIPTYTPLRTDEPDVSQKSVFLGGINAYLQQKLALFRHTPRFLDWVLDLRPLLRWASRFAIRTQAEELADLAISVLRGAHGYQRKEVARLVDWLASDLKPDVVLFSNVLISGIVHPLRERLRVPVLATLQGDDVFLDALPAEPRSAALKLVRDHCREIDGFIATSRYYAEFMADYLEIAQERIDVVYPGLNLQGHGLPRPQRSGQAPAVGYFARICSEKGLHNLVDAYCRLRQEPGALPARLYISGWLGGNNRGYLEEQKVRLRRAGLEDEATHVESPDHASKVRFMQSIDVLSVPTTYREPKGLYVLEALANGVPVVQPRHGSFPELIEATGGGVLVEPDNPANLAQVLRRLLDDPTEREKLGQRGKQAVFERFHARAMAEATLAVFRKYRP
jgi:glycosyltransferase involved in cell wall biosynthesis